MWRRSPVGTQKLSSFPIPSLSSILPIMRTIVPLLALGFLTGWVVAQRPAQGEKHPPAQTTELPSNQKTTAEKYLLGDSAKISDVAERTVKSVVNVSSTKIIR